MTSAVGTSALGAVVFKVPSTLGVGSRPQVGGVVLGKLRLPTDPVGAFVLTLINLVVGSNIRIEIASTGALIEFRAGVSATEVFTISAYAPGNASNNLRIKVRKGAATFYKPYETLATAVVGAQSIYVSQILD